MKVLNLYAGIGGNRKLWTDVEVTAVEINPQIAKIYQDFFPQDKVIVADAHQYLLDHFKEFEFIWSSPPCPTHSKLGMCRYFNDNPITGCHIKNLRYPDMRLYEEIILLKTFCETKWVVENVVGYYEPLIYAQEIHRHYFWSNFIIRNINFSGGDKIEKGLISDLEKRVGFDLGKYKNFGRKNTILRNCVLLELGLHILNESKRNIQAELFV